MKVRSGHLRLVPKPLAKCEPSPPPRPYPPSRLDGVEVRRVSGSKPWWIQIVHGGQSIEVWLTTAEMRELVVDGALMLQRDAEDQ